MAQLGDYFLAAYETGFTIKRVPYLCTQCGHCGMWNELGGKQILLSCTEVFP